ncbi:hypothetical protein MCAV_04120 [[Mycoplasma] cavipharyngis]|uniref:hypothetical protein n=1 Tax=[Mycoplasma] cavipharyngis TaxID=92757 RepID=UPI0037048780
MNYWENKIGFKNNDSVETKMFSAKKSNFFTKLFGQKKLSANFNSISLNNNDLNQDNELIENQKIEIVSEQTIDSNNLDDASSDLLSDQTNTNQSMIADPLLENELNLNQDPVVVDSVEDVSVRKNKTIFIYDDLSPSKNLHWIINHKFINRFRNDWIKFDAIKFKDFLKLLSFQNDALINFFFLNFDREKTIYLSKLHAVEALDFVINQYNLFQLENSITNKMITSNRVEIPLLDQNHPELVTLASKFYESEQLNQFAKNTILYFLKQKIMNQKQVNDLIYLLNDQRHTKLSFLDAVVLVLNNKTLSFRNQPIQKSYANNFLRSRIVAKRVVFQDRKV